jgi:hypothetical protein
LFKSELRGLVPAKNQKCLSIGLTSTKVSDFEQTIAVRPCCSDRNRGIALSGQKTTPPGIIGLGGVARFTAPSRVISPNVPSEAGPGFGWSSQEEGGPP